LAGDEVLKVFATCLTGAVRQKIDWVGRYGGEEFIVVLPETNQAGAMILAERFRQAIEKCEIRFDDCTIPATTSIGVTGFSPQEGKNSVRPEMLLNQADMLLYRAKEAGRNRVIGALLPL
jgi:diguanylate cyclase (GGDEF)-like protein